MKVSLLFIVLIILLFFIFLTIFEKIILKDIFFIIKNINDKKKNKLKEIEETTDKITQIKEILVDQIRQKKIDIERKIKELELIKNQPIIEKKIEIKNIKTLNEDTLSELMNHYLKKIRKHDDTKY